MLLAVPQKRVTFKRPRKTITYVYYTIRAYRNEKKQPTSDEVLIGKLDSVTGMLVPNKRYFEIFPEQASIALTDVADSGIPQKSHTPQIKQIKICGECIAMYEIAKQIGLLAVLQECFSDKWEKILAVAFYILSKSSTMMHIEDWFFENKLGFLDFMSDASCSRLFASISYDERQLFFQKWIGLRLQHEYVAYDVTSISTYSHCIEKAEWGYNRDNEKLPQVNYGMFYGMESQVPVYYDLYSGSINDKSTVKYLMLNANGIGIKEVCFVFDRGIGTKENYSFILEQGYSFLTALSETYKEYNDLIDLARDKIEKSEYRINDHRVNGIQCSVSLFGQDLQAHIYFSNEKKTTDTEELYAYIDRLRAELTNINKTKGLPKRYSNYFKIDEQAKKTFVFDLDNEKINSKLNYMGYFILITNKPELTSTEALKIYREKDVIEKHFDQLKNGLDFERLKTHNNKTTDGKVFTAFISLILRSYMLNAIKNNPETKKLSFEKVQTELKHIQSVIMSGMKETLTTLTGLQKTILSVLKVNAKLLLQ